MKKLLTIAVFAIFSASSAMSASLTPTIGVSMNHAGYAAEGIEKSFRENGAGDKTTEEYGAFTSSYGSIFLELGIGEIFSVGVDYVPTAIETPTNISREGTTLEKMDPGKSTVSADFEDLTTVYAKMNIPMLGGTYVKVGHSQVDVIINDKMVSGNSYKDVDTEGYMAGIGYNHEMDNGLSIRLEATVNQFDDVQTDNGVTTASKANGGQNKVEVNSMWGARGTLSIVKSF